MRLRISRLPSPRPGRRESRYWFLPTLPTGAQQPSCNSPAGILPRSTRPQVNRVRLVEKVCLMRIVLILGAAALLTGVPSANAQAVGTAPPVIQDRSYKLLREDEDWSFLRDRSLREDFWDPIKYIPLRRNSPDWYLTFSGQAREVWEQTGNNNWGQQPFWNSFFLERYMLGFDAHYGKRFRTFVEFKSGLESFRIGGPRPIDEKKLDFQNAFLDVGTGGEQNWVTLRVGVQELEYGAGRLIDVREGPNVRLSFIGFRILSKVGSWRIDGFAVRPREDNFGFFDDVPNHQVEFWGVYSSRPLSRGISIDAYYLGLNRAQATYQRGQAREARGALW